MTEPCLSLCVLGVLAQERFLSPRLGSIPSRNHDLLLRPDRHAGGASRYSAGVFESYKDPIPCRIKRNIAIPLDEDPKGRRRIGVDLRGHNRTNR
jgi:hypothetical protein